MNVNPSKLYDELTAAGIPVEGCSSEGRIDFALEATQAQRDQAAVILAAHDPTPLPFPPTIAELAERVTALEANVTVLVEQVNNL